MVEALEQMERELLPLANRFHELSNQKPLNSFEEQAELARKVAAIIRQAENAVGDNWSIIDAYVHARMLCIPARPVIIGGRSIIGLHSLWSAIQDAKHGADHG